MNVLGPIAVIVASLIALSSFIIAKKPEAKQLFEKIQPYQGFLGVGLLAWGVYDLIRMLEFFGPFLKYDMVFGICAIAYVASEILLGFILGFGLIATWIPGEGAAEKKGVEIHKKLLGFSLPIGIIGLVSAVYFLIKMP